MHLFHLLLSLTAIFAQVALSSETLASPSARHQGTGSCSSSNCHGSVSARKDSNVLQNEYYTWSKHDPHSKAYSVLTQSDALRMTRHLNLGAPTSEPLCLKCHSTYIPDAALRGERYSIEDGVSCESCHGAAESWLASHAATGATHQQNLENGLHDTVTLEKRAKLCLSCHQGDQSKQVTHELYGAGHPRLRFELDTYGILQPKHWLVDQDYRDRKQDYIPVRAWLVGQVVQAQGLLYLLQNPDSSSKAHKQLLTLPDFSLFDCYSCHHSLSQSQWKDRVYTGEPGRLHINITPFILVQAALEQLAPPLATRLGDHVSQLRIEYLAGAADSTLASLASLLSEQVLPFARHVDSDVATCKKIIGALAALGDTTKSIKFELAEQIGMGIQAALATHPASATPLGDELRSLFETIKNPDGFSPTKFSKALGIWQQNYPSKTSATQNQIGRSPR